LIDTQSITYLHLGTGVFYQRRCYQPWSNTNLWQETNSKLNSGRIRASFAS